MEHGIDGLQEYQGAPDEIVEFVGKAELLVTHLAPVSAQMLDQMSNLRMIAVARGAPVNIDVPAARQRSIRMQLAWAQCQCGGGIHRRRNSCGDAAHPIGS